MKSGYNKKKVLLRGAFCSAIALGMSLWSVGQAAPTISIPQLERAGLVKKVNAPATRGTHKLLRGAKGVVVADEPRAALAGSEVLDKGGNAADAAVATYFALSVTYPNAAGLGGGGVCLYHNTETGISESIDFLPRNPAGGGAVAVPGSVRGFALLHARYGDRDWDRIVEPAELLAAQGFPITRALAERVAANSKKIRGDAGLKDAFVLPSTLIKGPGDQLSNVALASTLALIRSQGATGFYLRSPGSDLVAANKNAKGKLTKEDLRSYRAISADPTRVSVDGRVILSPADRTGAGTLAGQVLPQLATGDAGKKDPGEGLAASKAALDKALAGYGVSKAMPDDFGSTSFVAVGPDGDAVACSVTMNGPFGLGKTVKTAGFAMAPAPASSAEGLSGAFLMPTMVVSEDGEEIFFVGAAAGGKNAMQSSFYLTSRLGAKRKAKLEEVIAPIPSSPTDTVNAFYCSDGFPERPKSCEISADPHGYGLTAQGGKASSGVLDFF